MVTLLDRYPQPWVAASTEASEYISGAEAEKKHRDTTFDF